MWHATEDRQDLKVLQKTGLKSDTEDRTLSCHRGQTAEVHRGTPKEVWHVECLRKTGCGTPTEEKQDMV